MIPWVIVFGCLCKLPYLSFVFCVSVGCAMSCVMCLYLCVSRQHLCLPNLSSVLLVYRCVVMSCVICTCCYPKCFGGPPQGHKISALLTNEVVSYRIINVAHGDFKIPHRNARTREGSNPLLTV